MERSVRQELFRQFGNTLAEATSQFEELLDKLDDKDSTIEDKDETIDDLQALLASAEEEIEELKNNGDED